MKNFSVVQPVELDSGACLVRASRRCAIAQSPVDKSRVTLGLHDFALGGKNRPGHPLGVPHDAAGNGQCRIVEAACGEARSIGPTDDVRLPEQRRAAF